MRPKMEKGECMKLSQIGKIALPLALAGTLVAGVPLEALACTQVWMPDSLTAEKGVWYFGRSEDGGYRGVKIFGVEPAHESGFKYYSEETSFEWSSPSPTYRYTYVRDHGNNWASDIKSGINTSITNAYSAAGINEHGVSCSATLSIYPLKTVVGKSGWDANNEDSGVGEYNYASIILGQSKTAREGVELIGKLVSEYGAAANDQIVISDAKESWLLMVVSGHEWLAFQLPEDQASVNPNIGGLAFDVDLNDPNVLHSSTIVSRAQEAGALKYLADGKTPDICKTYFGENNGKGSWSRYAMGRLYFGSNAGHKVANGEITAVDDLSLFFKPGRSDYTTYDMIRSLAARGEGSDIDANKGDFDPIGKNWSLETHIFEVRRGMDPEIATVQWLALSRDEFSVAIPNYSALLTKVNEHYGSFANIDSGHQDGNDGSTWSDADSVEAAKQPGEWDNYLPYVLMDINTLAYHNRDNVASGLRAYLDAMQNELIAQHDQVEAVMLKTDRGNRQRLANQAADAAAEQTWVKCEKVLQEIRTYLNGNQETPFVPSDYNAATKSLVVPMTYAQKAVAGIPVAPDKPATPDKPVAPAVTSLAKAKVSTAKTSYTWTGKAVKPKVTVKLGSKTLKAGTDYTVSYKANKNVGRATITVAGKGAYSGKVTKAFKIVPKKVGVSKLAKGKKSLTVKWKKPSKSALKQVSGYQVKYSAKKSMKSAKVKTVKSAKKTSLKVSKLKGGKKYYVQVRAYKKVKVGGKTVTYYSGWSKAKAATTRK